MYEASFGLKRRPFAATPDATCLLASGPIQAALDELVVCVEQGQGIAILTAPAGTGKTLLCERLRSELDERFETVFLRHASFLTRRALLQTILCELNYSYHHPSEQELRLELFPAIRALQPKREALVLICDEAHQLNDSLLEELRILADFAEAGRPLVRLVLVGQLGLEEKLAQPGLEAFNQRIRAQVNLNTFDHAGSIDYIDYRLTWAGGRTDEIFTPDAVELIARVSDGVPRCINQLADHALLLAFVAEQHPVSEELVREALSDLRQLPLHWNEPPQSLSTPQRSSLSEADSTPDQASDLVQHDASGILKTFSSNPLTYSFEPGDEAVSSGSYETGDEIPFVAQSESVEVGSSDWNETVELFNPQKEQDKIIDAMKSIVAESSHGEFSHESKSKLSRRIQFHDLVQDAYEIASQSKPDKLNDTTQRLDEIDGNSDTVVVPRSHLASLMIPDFNAPMSAPGSNFLESPSDSEFHEEMIVDRYTSIDAGLEPPEIPATDTVRVPQVRDVIAPSVINPHSNVVTFGTAPAEWHQVQDEGETQIVDLDDTAESLEAILGSPAAGILRDGYQLNKLSAYDTAADSFWANDSRSEFSSLRMNRDTSSLSDIEGVVNDVVSIGESLRPFDSLSENSDSILKSLRDEVGINPTPTAQPTAVETAPVPPPVPAETHWESVETPQVEKVEENRPFKYLFSMLRRKQQGL